jgi:hypothetical protein
LPDGLLFKPKIPFWVNFGGIGKCLYILLTWEYFMEIWDIL